MKSCPRIIAEVIDHNDQRYPTVGDWWFNKEKTELHIRVSRMGDWRSEFAVAFHEAYEALACEENGITDERVTEFDLLFENERTEGLHDAEDEPGDDARAPYRVQHFDATALEMQVTTRLGLSWSDHERNVYAL